MVALGRRWVLAGLLGGRVWIVSITVLRKRLAVRAVQLCALWRILATPDGVRGDEGLRLGGDGGEDAFLGEAGAVGAAAVFRRVEAGAANLPRVSNVASHGLVNAPPDTYLAASAVSTGYCGTLARGGLLGRVAHWGLLVSGRRAIHLLRRRQRAVLVWVLGLQGLHDWTLRDGLGDGWDLGRAVHVSGEVFGGERGIDDGAHVCRCFLGAGCRLGEMEGRRGNCERQKADWEA